MKKRDKIIYITLLLLIILPILIPRLIIEYDLRVYSPIKIGTTIHTAVEQVKELNNRNRFLLNFFINRGSNEEDFTDLNGDVKFLNNENRKIILSSGLTYENNLKNSYYINNILNNCYLVISFNDKEVIANTYSCKNNLDTLLKIKS